MTFFLTYWKQIAAIAIFIGLMSFSWHQGAISERVKWQTRENVQQAAYSAKLIETEAKYRAIENKRAIDARNNEAIALKQLKEVTDEKNRIIANLRNGAIRVRESATVSSCDSGMPKVATNSGEPDGKTQCGLSQEFSGWLVDRFYQADSEVILLNMCIAQLHADRQ